MRRTDIGILPDGTHVLVETWDNGNVTIATRAQSWDTWSPPTILQRADVGSLSEWGTA